MTYLLGFAGLFVLGVLAWVVALFVGWLGWQYVKRRWLTYQDKERQTRWRKS